MNAQMVVSPLLETLQLFCKNLHQQLLSSSSGCSIMCHDHVSLLGMFWRVRSDYICMRLN